MNAQQREVADAAFQAFNAMETTKRRHFDFLNMLEAAAKKWNLKPTAEQEAIRAKLLADHDRQVQIFKSLSDALRERDTGAFAALWAYIGEIHAAFQPLNEQQQH